MAHPTIAKSDSHIQHGHYTIHQPLTFIVQESELRIRYYPQVIGLYKFLENNFVIVFYGTNAWSLQPTLVTAHAMSNLHVRSVDNLHLFILNQSLYLLCMVIA